LEVREGVPARGISERRVVQVDAVMLLWTTWLLDGQSEEELVSTVVRVIWNVHCELDM
jgi:hypothetical protein